MTLLLDEVTSLVAGAAGWLAVVVLLGALPAIAVARMRPRPLVTAVRVAVVAGLLAAGASARLGLPDPLEFAVAGRPLPAGWVLAGASVAALIGGWRQVNAEGSAATPTPDAARP